MTYGARPELMRFEIADTVHTLSYVRARVLRGDDAEVPLVLLRQCRDTAAHARNEAAHLERLLSHHVRLREGEQGD